MKIENTEGKEPWDASSEKAKTLNAIEPYRFTLIPGKHNENYSEVKRMYAPMYFNERIIPVKFTIMVMLNESEGKRIYSLEAIDADLDKK